jgi:hypothetical protein
LWVTNNDQESLRPCDSHCIRIIKINALNNEGAQTIESTGIGNKSQGVSEVIFNKVFTASNGGNDDHTAFLHIMRTWL